MNPADWELRIQRGTDFRQYIWLESCDGVIIPDDIIFTVSNRPNGFQRFRKSLLTTPSAIVLDDDPLSESYGLFYILLTAIETSGINRDSLYYQIDIVTDNNIQRWLTGDIIVEPDAVA